MVIYVDVLLITNFFVTYFLLLASSVVCGYTYNRKRIVISAALGAAFCMCIFIPQQGKFIGLFVKLLSLTVCSVVAFGTENRKKTVIQAVCFAVLNMLLTGTAILISLKSTMVYENNMFCYFGINPVILVLSSLLIYIVLIIFEMIKEKITPQQQYTMDIIFRDFSVRGLKAFYDSGFKVKDLVSNKDIVITEFDGVKEHLPQKLKEDIHNFICENYTEVTEAFIPVFFNTLSGKGMIPSVKAEYILINGKKVENILIGFTQNPLSENVKAIFGADIRKQL